MELLGAGLCRGEDGTDCTGLSWWLREGWGRNKTILKTQWCCFTAEPGRGSDTEFLYVWLEKYKKQQRAATFLREIIWKLGVNSFAGGLKEPEPEPGQGFTFPAGKPGAPRVPGWLVAVSLRGLAAPSKVAAARADAAALRGTFSDTRSRKDSPLEDFTHL